MPAQQRLRRHNRCEFGKKLSPESFGFRGQTPALIVSESQPSLAQLFAKHSILFSQVFDRLELVLIYPSGERDQKKPERIETSTHGLR